MMLNKNELYDGEVTVPKKANRQREVIDGILRQLGQDTITGLKARKPAALAALGLLVAKLGGI